MAAGFFVFISQTEGAGSVMDVDEVAGLQAGAFQDRFFSVQDTAGCQRDNGGQCQIVLARTVVVEGTDDGNIIMPDVLEGHDHQVRGSLPCGIGRGGANGMFLVHRGIFRGAIGFGG